MKDDSNVEEFLAQRKRMRKESNRIYELVTLYKKETPNVLPLWDTTPDSIAFNNIDTLIVESGMDIYSAPFNDVWKGIFEPEVYDSDTLWENVHDNNKIARVIEAWERSQPLSPPFLVKHLDLSMALVADGKHRLTVARYMGCTDMPFMIQSTKSNWLLEAIPSAIKI